MWQLEDEQRISSYAKYACEAIGIKEKACFLPYLQPKNGRTKYTLSYEVTIQS